MSETMPNDGRALSLLPSEYYKRQFFSCFWFERSGLRTAIEVLGAHTVLFETDFLTDAPVPRPAGCRAPLAGGARRQTRRLVLQDNAAALYRIPLARAIAGGATRSTARRSSSWPPGPPGPPAAWPT